MLFNEATLEAAIMELLADEGYSHYTGDSIHRENTEVLLTEDIKMYLLDKYSQEDITVTEVNSIILMLRSVSGSLYEANKTIMDMVSNGFTFNREDRSKKDIFIELIDFVTPENNIFKVVNQVEIQGYEKRIPDGIIYINGLPLVVFEFKSAVRENATIHDAYTQLTVRYVRAIPELLKYNAFVAICDGASNKYGSIFAPYDNFYSWRKVDDNDEEV